MMKSRSKLGEAEIECPFDSIRNRTGMFACDFSMSLGGGVEWQEGIEFVILTILISVNLEEIKVKI